MAIQGAAPEVGRITPHLLVRDGRAAIEFYQRAFGARLPTVWRCGTVWRPQNR